MDNIDPLRILLAFGFVLGLIGLAALALRYLSRRCPAWMGAQVGAGRLHIVETRVLDARRRLVLVKRDAQEHLLLLSLQGDVVVEKVESHGA